VRDVDLEYIYLGSRYCFIDVIMFFFSLIDIYIE
jgi:hypothetical protein